ncbi:MAG: hypothetical protein JW999_03625 [Methanotrichaceae archaeon]|nr:hypothetical protein [Methanotrichaceae archaeon]
MIDVPLVALGHLIRDIIYQKNDNDGQIYLVGHRGGGSIWNVLANAAANGSNAIAFCVGGEDNIAELCLEELRYLGVTIAGKKLLNRKATRTIHETLTYKGFRPIHKCSSVCPVCSSKTYNTGTAKLSPSIIDYFTPKLKKLFSQKLIIHIDNFNKTRLNVVSSLRNSNTLITVDLGRLISFFRMDERELLENLKDIDILFINSILIPKLLHKLGLASEVDLLKCTSIRVLISLRGEYGIRAWINSDNGIKDISQNAAKAKHLTDTSGAGDAFIGFFLSRIALRSINDIKQGRLCESDIKDDLWKAQEWAARKCEFVGARGHLKDFKWDLENTSGRSKCKKELNELRLQNEGLSKCCVCGSLFDDRSPIDRSRVSINVLRFHGNVLSLPKSIERSWSRRNNTAWPEMMELNGPGYIIGTGGSFVAASFIAQLISSKNKCFAMPIKPFDFIRTGFQAPFAIFISNSGKTPDILSAIKYAQNIDIPKLILISGNKKMQDSGILRDKKDVFLYTGANEDRGFLSVLGVFSPCFLSWAALNEIWSNDLGYRYFNDMYSKAEIKVNNNFYRYKRKIDFNISGRKSIILGGGFSWPSMLNIESKMVESNFGRPQISEIKDYSHGRFVSSMDQNVLAIICGMPDDKEYRNFLIERLRNKNDVIELESEECGPLGSLELLLQAEHLMKCFAEKEDVDISKPKVPRSGLELYRYKNLLK